MEDQNTIYFYVVKVRSDDDDWTIGYRDCETLEEAQRRINIDIHCQFDDFFRYEISGNEKTRDIWDRKEKKFVRHYRIELYKAIKVGA